MVKREVGGCAVALFFIVMEFFNLKDVQTGVSTLIMNYR